MVRISFTKNIQHHVRCPDGEVEGDTVRDVLDGVLSQNQTARGYVLDDRGALRKPMVVFVNGKPVRDRSCLSDRVPDGAEVYVMQALSGG